MSDDLAARLRADARPLQHMGNEEEALAMTAYEAADEIERLRALLRECAAYLPPDTGWCYDEPTGWLNDRVEEALR